MSVGCVLTLTCQARRPFRSGGFLLRWARYGAYAPRLLRDRLMVGLSPLERCILVRIQVPQPRLEVSRRPNPLEKPPFLNLDTMAKAFIKLNDGTTVDIEGSVEEIEKVLALYSRATESVSTEGFEARVSEEIVVATPTKSEKALEWAKAQIGRCVQTCNTPGCKYNYEQSGAAVCSTPNPRADDDDIKKENSEAYHPFWNFYCMRFVRSTYKAPAEYAKAHDMYEALSRSSAIKTDENIPLGALVFWFWSTYGHIGIYSDNGKVIHTGVNPVTKKNGIRESLITEVTEVLDGYNHYQSPRTSYLGWANPPEAWLK